MNPQEKDSPERTSRFSTPVPDLDDHRNQGSLSPLDAVRPTQPEDKGGRKVSISTHSRHEPVMIVEPPLEPIQKELENAITDDDGDDTKANTPVHPRTGSNPRRGLSKRIQQRLAGAVHSRDSSPSSSRSSSPPNSDDAFAEPRRSERANTFGSKAPSDLALPITRTVSGGTDGRRPTISSANPRHEELQQDSDRPEEDVCFPRVEEPTKTFSIDFEEMQEFVAEAKRNRGPYVSRRKHSFSSSGATDKQKRVVSNVKKTDLVQSPLSFSRESISRRCGSVKAPSLNEKSKTQEVLEDQGVNRFSFFSSELEKTIHAPELGDLLEDDESFHDLFDLPAETGAWWLDVMNPTEDELDMFQKAFDVHRLTTEDIERQEIREKVELFHRYYFVCFRSFYQMDKNSEDYLEPVNIYMVVFREGILTFSYAANPHAAEVRKRIGKLRNYINLTADWICYALMYSVHHQQFLFPANIALVITLSTASDLLSAPLRSELMPSKTTCLSPAARTSACCCARSASAARRSCR